MAEAIINNGVGVVWGVSSGALVSGTGFLLPVEQDFHKTRQAEPHHTQQGNVQGETFFRKESTIRMRVYPSGATMAAAKSANANLAATTKFDPGKEIVVVDTDDTEIAGEWSVTEVTKQHRFADKVYWDLGLRRHGDNTAAGFSHRISQETPAGTAGE